MNYTQPFTRIAIIGAGKLGSLLGSKWAACGNLVRYGVRNVNSPRAQRILDARIENAEVDSIQSALDFGEFIVLAVPADAMFSILAEYSNTLRGKVILDPSQGSRTLFNGARLSFYGINLFGLENLEQPCFGDTPCDLFYCTSGDESVNARTDQLIGQLGFRPINIGGLDLTKTLQSLELLAHSVSQQRRTGHRVAIKILT